MASLVVRLRRVILPGLAGNDVNRGNNGRVIHVTGRLDGSSAIVEDVFRRKPAPLGHLLVQIERLRHAFAQPRKRLLRQRQPPALEVRHAPHTPQPARPQRKRHQ